MPDPTTPGIPGRALDTDAALELIETARRIGAGHGLTVTVAVVDAAGHPVALARGKNWHGPYLALGKARLSAAFRKPTRVLLEQWADRPLFAQSLTEVIPGGVTLNPGGYPIFDGSACVGAIGVGGGSPDQDDLVARLAVEAIGAAAPLVKEGSGGQ
jgi:uncharacterized protein GlcG (DUF336 family)